jgi:protein gp37
MQETGIEWCDFSSNLLKYRDNATNKVVWACVKCSPGCAACYAETLAHRYGRGGPYSLQQTRKVTPFFDMDETKKILRSKKIGGARIFIDDMTDLFGEWVPDEIIDKHFALFALRPDVTFQVLTKRPERMAKYLEYTNASPIDMRIAAAAFDLLDQQSPEPAVLADLPGNLTWPLGNVWLGCSCEDHQRADHRIPHLLKCRAAVTFVSAEPLLESINFARVKMPGAGFVDAFDGRGHDGSPTGGRDFKDDSSIGSIDWIIVGGESGAHARPCNVEWVRDIVRQCKSSSVPVFVKQMGSRVELRNDRASEWGRCGDVLSWESDDVGYQGELAIARLEDGKGGDPSEWPEDLRVREMPDAKVPA